MKRESKERKFSKATFDLMVKFAIKHYGLTDFDPYFTFSLSKKRKHSWGGFSFKRDRPFVDIAGHRGRTDHIYFVQEYPEYENDSQIGSYSGEWRETISGTIAHELAHAIEFFMIHYSYHFALKFPQAYNNEHGPLFKSIYRTLRNQFDLCIKPKL